MTRWGAGLRAWWDARVPRDDTHRLTQRNVYILPTGAGWFFAAVLMVLLVASINYQLSLGYGLTFLLAGSAVVSMHQTHGTLRGLRLQIRPPTPGFADATLPVDVAVDNPGRARHGLWIGWRDETAGPSAGVWFDVEPGARHTLRLGLVPGRRGHRLLPALVLRTRFPFGLFQAWTVWRPASSLLAWPAPERPTAPLPPGTPVGPTSRVGAGSGVEFQGVRPWRRGDSPRQVVWKKAARTAASWPDDGQQPHEWDPAQLVSRDTAQGERQALWLDWESTGLPRDADPEKRLSRLAAWVVRADELGAEAGLRLPGCALPPASGQAHRRAMLDALALWPQGAA